MLGPPRFEKGGDGLAIGLTFGGFHDLAGEEALKLSSLLVISGTEIGPLIGTLGDQ